MTATPNSLASTVSLDTSSTKNSTFALLEHGPVTSALSSVGEPSTSSSWPANAMLSWAGVTSNASQAVSSLLLFATSVARTHTSYFSTFRPPSVAVRFSDLLSKAPSVALIAVHAPPSSAYSADLMLDCVSEAVAVTVTSEGKATSAALTAETAGGVVSVDEARGEPPMEKSSIWAPRMSQLYGSVRLMAVRNRMPKSALSLRPKTLNDVICQSSSCSLKLISKIQLLPPSGV
jgi:hypothetical protein